MKKIRILIVDDSVVVRRLMSEILSQDPDLEVVGVAATGRMAMAKVEHLKPDIVTMDSDMPDLDGVQMLLQLRKNHPNLPVILFSSPTEYGGVATLDALSMGANDYVTKPSQSGGITETIVWLRESLIPKIKGLSKNKKILLAPLERGKPVALSAAAAAVARLEKRLRPIEVLAIGISTGGPNALAAMMPGLPEDFPVPILIVQHMPTVFTRMLAERLQGVCNLRVQEGTPDQVISRGQVWIAPGGYHMGLKRDGNLVRLVLNQDPPENSCRPAVDVLFRSVASVYGAGTLGVIMTGMGHDGLRGSEVIRNAQGRILAQDEASSVVWGMPGAVATAGLAERIVPLDRLAQEITTVVVGSRAALYAQKAPPSHDSNVEKIS